MALFDELKRRNVIRVALAYLAGAWLLVQVLETVLPLFDVDDAVTRMVVIVLAIGFVPALILSWLFQLTPTGLKPDREARFAHTDTRKMDRTIIVVLVIAVIYFAVDKFVGPPPPPESLKVVVLPFDNLTGDPEQEFFSHGMAEELLDLLQRVPELVVVSRTTGALIKKDDLTVPEIAQKVGATHVLEGSFRQSGETYRVTAQLIDAREDAHLFSETYDRQPEDVLSLQKEIAALVADALAVELVYPPESAANIDPEAYELYLRGRYVLDLGVETSEQLEQAFSDLQRAVELEPEWPSAISELARAYWRKTNNVPAAQREASLAEMKELVALLHELEPDGSDSNGWSMWIAWRLEQDYYSAARYGEAALAADPYDPASLRLAANLLAAIGREEEALAIGEYVLEQDPACTLCINNIAYMLRSIGRYRDAAEKVETVLQWYPADDTKYWQTGAAWLGAGEPQNALDYFDKMSPGNFRDFARLFALYSLGRMEEFEREFAALRDGPDADTESNMRVYAWIGDFDRAFELLDDMVAEYGAARTADLVGSDFYNQLRADPRWSEFLDEHDLHQGPVPTVPFDPVLPAVIQADIDSRRQVSDGASRP